MSNSEDLTIISRLKRGDRQAFNEVVSKHQNKVINIAYGMLSNSEDAYDAAQEVFIKVYKSIDLFEEKSSLSTWIYRITKNVCMDMLRKRMRTTQTMSINDGFLDDEPEIIIKDTAPTPQEKVEISETQQEVRNAINNLSDEFKTIITLFDLEGLSYEEISKIIECPIGTVKSRLSRARKALKKQLSEKKHLFF